MRWDDVHGKPLRSSMKPQQMIAIPTARSTLDMFRPISASHRSADILTLLAAHDPRPNRILLLLHVICARRVTQRTSGMLTCGAAYSADPMRSLPK